MKKVRPEPDMPEQARHIMAVAAHTFGKVKVVPIYMNGLNKWEYKITYGPYSWSLYVPEGAVLTNEEIRVMLERDYLRSMDERH